MATYRPTELHRKWSQGELTLEQAIGQLLQYLLDLIERLTELEKRLRQLEQVVAKPQS
jgi:hypothetical protein